jgi:hypothetical protein
MSSDPNRFLREDDMTPGDTPRGADDDAVTPAGQRGGAGLERRLASEEPDRPRTPEEAPEGSEGEILDEDRPDEEPDLVGTLAGTEDDPIPGEEDTLPAEEQAVEVSETAPGATDDVSDGYVEPGTSD